MATPANYRWRKTTDINREYALFELLADEVSILDAGFSNTGVFEISFNPKITESLIEWETLRQLIDAGKELAEQDR